MHHFLIVTRSSSPDLFESIFVEKSVSANDCIANGPLVVDMPSDVGVVRAAWWDIWAAGVAVDTLCIKNGKKGTASNYGKSWWKSGILRRRLLAYTSSR